MAHGDAMATLPTRSRIPPTVVLAGGTRKRVGRAPLRDAASRHEDWVLGQRDPATGWFGRSGFTDLEHNQQTAVTHTIAYTLWGLLHGGLILGRGDAVAAARHAAANVAAVVCAEGRLPGMLDSKWRPRSSWECLTGNAQMAIVWMRLADIEPDDLMEQAARTCLDRVAAVQSLGDFDSRNPRRDPRLAPGARRLLSVRIPQLGSEVLRRRSAREGTATLDRRIRRSSAQRRMIEGALDTLASRSTTMDLTIIIATADRPALLEQTLRSVLASMAATRHEVRTRVFVIDDAASGSAEPVASALGVDYAKNPLRDDRRNPSSARSWGIRQVETEFVGLFDDDDEMLPDHIRSLTGRLARGADVCATGYWLAYPNPADPCRLVRGRAVVPRLARLGDLLRDFQPVNDQSVMRTHVAGSVTWDPDRENEMMYHVWLQLLMDGGRFVVHPAPTYLYRQHQTSLSHTLDARDAILREQLLQEYGALAIERFGRLPEPSLGVRLRLVKAAAASALHRAGL